MNVALILLNQIDEPSVMSTGNLPEQVQAVLQTLPEEAEIQVIEAASCGMDDSEIRQLIAKAGNADLILLCAFTNDPRTKQIAAESGRRVCVDVDHFEVIDQTLYAARSIYSTHAEELIPAENLIATIGLPEPSKEEVDLAKAKIVFLAGKGLGNKQNYERMAALAQKMGAVAACTRAAVLSGWGGYEKIVGISGQSLNADVVVAFGVSGAGPLLRGLKSVKTLIAINTDKKAPIFRYAQYGIADDCVKMIDLLEKKREG